MNNYLDGFDRKEITLESRATVEKGMLVSMAENFTVKPSPINDAFAGICTGRQGSCAGVLLSGYTEVAYSGETPSFGYNNVVADGDGGIKKDEGGRAVLVVMVDKTASICGIIL